MSMFYKLIVLFLVLEITHGYFYYRTTDDIRDIRRHLEKPKQNQQKLKQEENEKVKIHVYYEALCPFSIAFHTKNFNATVNLLAPYLDFQTYPYGNARTKIDKNGKVTIVCQHGPSECYGNMLHACAIDALGMTTSAVTYNSCMMSWSQSNGSSDDSSADTCGKLFSVDSEPIKACAKGDKGKKLLKHYSDETKKSNKASNGVPYILLNGKQFDNDNDLKKAVCQALKNPPQACL